MDDKTKRLACRMVAGLVASDEDFDDSERAFLDKVLRQFGIPEDEWDAIFPLLDHDEAGETIKALDKVTQNELFELLMEAAMADGKMADEERDYLRVVGTAISLPAEELTARIS